ncbi:MAG: hypothetical protein NUV53_00765 [Patescibacteria group bacterium]|nr:hypothetical protein [Patescibacteria group bacterium]
MKKFLAPAIVTGITMASRVFAGPAGDNPGITIAANKEQVIDNILCPIIDYAFVIIMILSVLMVLYAAFLYVTAGSEDEKFSKAHKVLIYAAVGIVVALLARGFPYVIASLFGADGSLISC